MLREMASILRCPACKGGPLRIDEKQYKGEEILEAEIICSNCKAWYKIIDGIPIMLPNKGSRGREINRKQKQITYFAEKCDTEFEINRPHNTGHLYQYLIDYKFKKTFESLPESLQGLKVLDSCCGSGMACEYYANQGAKVVGLDMSFEAVKRAKIRGERYGFQAESVVGDSENLPFINDSFDIASIHDGLHHLEKPQTGVRELSRVAKKGFFIIEPARAVPTKISVFLGISTNYEEAGNIVYRFSENQLKRWAEELDYNHTTIVRYLMYYSHRPPVWFELFNNNFMSFLFLIGFHLTNLVLGAFGNKILFIAWNK